MATVQDFAGKLNSNSRKSILMNDDVQQYQDNNDISRRDATQCLEEYASKIKWNKPGAKIFEVGCADGSITAILIKYIPDDYKELVSCDINEGAVKFANEHHGDERTKFITLDIEDDLQSELKEQFDYVFSFYTFHWVQNQVKAFTNLFQLLSEDGECLLTLFGQMPVYKLFWALSRTIKWGTWLSECHKFLSPYFECHDPDTKIENMLKKIGFYYVDVKCKQKTYIYDSTEAFKNLVSAVNPFKFPEELLQEFLEDFIQMARDMKIVDETNNTVMFCYNVLIIHCKK